MKVTRPKGVGGILSKIPANSLASCTRAVQVVEHVVNFTLRNLRTRIDTRERDRHYPIFSSLETVCRPILAGQIRRCLVLSFKIRFFGKERGRNFRKIRPSSHSNLSFHHQTRFEPKLKRKRKRYNFVNKRTMLEIRLWRGLGSCGLFPSIQRNVEQTACSVIATLLNHTAS